jgi:hypothetical protein
LQAFWNRDIFCGQQWDCQNSSAHHIVTNSFV